MARPKRTARPPRPKSTARDPVRLVLIGGPAPLRSKVRRYLKTGEHGMVVVAHRSEPPADPAPWLRETHAEGFLVIVNALDLAAGASAVQRALYAVNLADSTGTSGGVCAHLSVRRVIATAWSLARELRDDAHRPKALNTGKPPMGRAGPHNIVVLDDREAPSARRPATSEEASTPAAPSLRGSAPRRTGIGSRRASDRRTPARRTRREES